MNRCLRTRLLNMNGLKEGSECHHPMHMLIIIVHSLVCTRWAQLADCNMHVLISSPILEATPITSGCSSIFD
jgi:hypothetical protein